MIGLAKLEPMSPASILQRMASSDGRTWVRSAGVAAVCVAIGLVVRFGLVAISAQPATYLPYFPAIVLAAVWAGSRGAAVAVLLSVTAVWVTALYGHHNIDLEDLAVRSGAFVLTAGFIAWIGVSLRESLRRLEGSVAHERSDHAALLTQDERMRLAQEVAGFGVFDWNIETREAYLSEGFLHNWGVTREVAVDREALLARVYPEDRERVRTTNDAALASGAVYEAEYRIVRDSDQAVRWLYVRGEVKLDAEGKARRTIGINQDVTERKEAEAALRESEAVLRESEERFRAMADSAPAPIWVTGASGGIAFVNRAMTEFFDVDAAKLAGDGWRDRIHPDDIEPLEASRAEARTKHEPYVFECRFRNAGGEWRWMRAYSRPRFTASGDFVGYVGIAFDVTEIRAGEAALRESEERFRLIADSVPINLWMGDAHGGCVYLNRTQRAFWGIEGEDLSGFSWGDMLHPDDAEHLYSVFGAAMAAHTPFSVEARYRHTGGEDWKLLQTIARPRFGADGEFLGMVGANLDITDERAIQAAIRDSEQQLKGMFDQAGAGIARTDLDGRIELVNERFATMLGQTPDSLVGLNVVDITWPEDRDQTLRNIAGSREGRAYSHTKRYLRADGQPVWGSSSVTPIPDERGHPRALVAVVIDLTQSRQAEAALRESEQRFRLIADSAPVPMWVSRLGGAREFVNTAYAAFLGETYDEALAEDWRDLVHREDGPRIRDEQSAGEASQAPFTLEARYRRADGDWRWLRSFSQPRWGPDGEHIGFIGVAFDVTEAKQASQDLQRINEILAERVSAALEQKAVAEAALAHAQKIEAVGRLTGGVAHDFNNLLTVVIGALDMILKYPDDAKKRVRMAEAAMAAARRGERLTHQLLAFSRRQALRPEVVDVQQLVGESEPLLRRAVGEAIGFELKLDGAAMVKVDPGQFGAALLNLVVNARDATPPGGVITVRSEVADVADGSAFESAPGRYAAVSVSDTGEGMSAEVINRAFEPFFTTKPVGKGTGLGLSQVYGFARQSGGGVAIESTPHLGTTVTVYLPVAAERAEAAALPASRGAQTPGAALRVLLVEDDPAVAAIAEALLRDLGHAVERAEAAEAALELLRGETGFDLLLTDVIMPGGMNGVQLARAAVTLRPGLAVVLTSGYAGEAIDEALVEAPWPFLRKPYAGAELAALLSGVKAAAEVV
jgi:PAS domain S-box-containing protein